MDNYHLTYELFKKENSKSKVDFKYFIDVVEVLKNLGIISSLELYKNEKKIGVIDENSKLIDFPDVFLSSKNHVLDIFHRILLDSSDNNWNYEKRTLKESSFEDVIYTKEKFVKDTIGILKEENVIEFNKDLDKKLVGKLDSDEFFGKGDKIKEILLQLASKCSTTTDKKAKLTTMKTNVENELSKIDLDSSQIDILLKHLEFYEEIFIDFSSLKASFENVKNKSIFFGKSNKIRSFCLGIDEYQLKNGKKILLKHNNGFNKKDICEAISEMVGYDEKKLEDQSNFKALMKCLNFDNGVKLEAIRSYSQYTFINDNDLKKAKEYLSTINLSQVVNKEDAKFKINNLDFSIYEPLKIKSKAIKSTLEVNLDKCLKIDDFKFESEDDKLEENEFEIIRSMLVDSNVIKSSVYNHLKYSLSDEAGETNPELERIFMVICQNEGCITDKNLVLKDRKTSSKELFIRLIDLGVVKSNKIDFMLAAGEYVPEFLGGNSQKKESDPAVQLENIKSQVENVIKKVFSIERADDTWHTLNDYVTGGIGTESKNKKLDEIIESVSGIIEQSIGSIKSNSEIKIAEKDLFAMLKGSQVPPEIMDYIDMNFELVLEYKLDKGFDWDCFLCALIGVAQLAAGVALEILSCGSAHYFAQILISEGISDIIFAVQAGIQGNFTWKSYAQHKIQSLIISLLTAGVGCFFHQVFLE